MFPHSPTRMAYPGQDPSTKLAEVTADSVPNTMPKDGSWTGSGGTSGTATAMKASCRITRVTRSAASLMVPTDGSVASRDR